MTPIKLVWRTDVHIADHGPSSRTDDWTETIFGKLAQVRDLAEHHGAAAILDGGDFFHVKSPWKNSQALVRRIADHHSDYPCPVYVTPGNHDSVYGDYGFLGQQPLGVLYSTGVFKRLFDDHEAVFVGDAPEAHAMAPAHVRHGMGALTVRVVGVPYHGSKYDLARFKDIKKGDEDILICVAHVLASPKGGSMFEGEDIVRYSDLIDTAPDVFLFGHWHKDQGVEILGDKTFVNIGSLSRGSLSQDEVQRQPACAVLTCSEDGVQVEVVRLTVQGAEECFDVEGRARQIKQQVEMDAFVERIRATLTSKEDGESLSEALDNIPSVPDDVRERARSYLEKA